MCDGQTPSASRTPGPQTRHSILEAWRGPSRAGLAGPTPALPVVCADGRRCPRVQGATFPHHHCTTARCLLGRSGWCVGPQLYGALPSCPLSPGLTWPHPPPFPHTSLSLDKASPGPNSTRPSSFSPRPDLGLLCCLCVVQLHKNSSGAAWPEPPCMLAALGAGGLLAACPEPVWSLPSLQQESCQASLARPLTRAFPPVILHLPTHTSLLSSCSCPVSPRTLLEPHPSHSPLG